MVIKYKNHKHDDMVEHSKRHETLLAIVFVITMAIIGIFILR